MKFVEYPNKARNAICIKDKEYPIFLKIVLKYTDTICFTIYPYLDDICEVKEDYRYKDIMESYLDSEYTKSIHTEDRKESLIYFKVDYFVREFLKNKRNIFDFCDNEALINLEDIVFISKKRIICDTLTHEQYCAVTDELEHEIRKSCTIV